MRLAKLQFLETMIKEFFRKIGMFIGCYPWWVLLGALITFLACISGFQHIEIETDIYTLFSIKDASAQKEKPMIEKTFPNNPRDHFEVGRFTSLEGANRVIITLNDNQTVLREDVLREVVLFDQMVRNITFHLSIPGKENQTMTYNDICSKDTKGRCFRNRILELFPKIQNGRFPKVSYPLTVNKGDEEVVPYFNTLGGVHVDSSGEVIVAEAICLTYFTNPNFDTKEYPWEKGVLNIVLNQNFSHINISFLSFNLLGDEMYKTAFGIMPYAFYTSALMVIICFIGCSFGDCTTTKSWIGIVGITASFYGGLAGFGLCQHLRIPFVPPSLSILFVIVGVGMDDAFVILAAWRRTCPSQSVPERLSRTLEQSGLAITISSLTNCLCFLIGATSPFSFAYCFCMYAAFGIALDYIFTVSIVGAALTIMGRIETSGRNAIFCLPIMNSSESELLIYLNI
ncbi:daf-6 [Cordylochernes scorpioides]|uniref:Daf-6 n=1 Tax=Cordylochernes scorpioides TaxID=51811 RepID=A0ABY6LLN8_9ARAC|nr:daf-6 [Cordylochernes scorpioides]